VRAVLSLGLYAVLSLGGRAASAATPADTVSTATRLETRGKIEALLTTYSKALGFRRWYRSADEPFDILAFYDNGLKYASRMEVVIVVSRQNTIGIRVFPHYNGPGPGDYIDLDYARDPKGLMQRALQLSAENFMFWAMDGSHHLFACFTVTLESGFPDAVLRVVLESVPLVDDSVGDLARYVL
jgi:hypothetical protein